MTRPLQTKAGEGERLSRDLSRSAGGPLPVANHAPAPPTASDWFPSATTKAADYFAARREGRRLPQHELEEAIVQHNFNQEHST